MPPMPMARPGPGGPPPGLAPDADGDFAPPGAPPEMAPPGMGPAPGTPMGAPGPPQFPSADPQAILALLSQLNAHDQQALGQAQSQADTIAAQLLSQGQVDPNAQAAATLPGPVGPPPGPNAPMAGSGY